MLVLLLSGCAVTEKQQQESALNQLDYKSAGRGAVLAKNDSLTYHSRSVEYYTPDAYNVLMKRMRKLGIQCREVETSPSNRQAKCMEGKHTTYLLTRYVQPDGTTGDTQLEVNWDR
jgi:hypothetical protein